MKQEKYYLAISSPKGLVFGIKKNGDVMWLQGKKLVKADTDEKLGKALGKALLRMYKINEKLSKK